MSVESDAVETGAGAPDHDSDSGRGRRHVGVVALLVVAVVATYLITRSSSDDGATASSTTLDAQTAAAIESAVANATATSDPSVPEVYESILPSIVFIEVHETAVAASVATGAPGDSADDSGDDDSGGDDSGGDSGTGLGSGVIINADGSILTANHVIANTDSIQVTFADGTTSPAHVELADPEHDTAVLTADRLPSVVVPAVIGSSQALQVGDAAIAVGHPLGLAGTLTDGVISGLDRSELSEDGTPLNGLIQFDAAVNPGSSGGPLLNARGQVVGVVVALANPDDNGFFIGIGFAEPIAATAGGGVRVPR